jgi:glycerophosphoryl diester phosphodiesterase
MLISHRGNLALSDCIENTLDAFRNVMSTNHISGFECDLRYNKFTDDIVIFHNESTKDSVLISNLHLSNFSKHSLCSLRQLLQLAVDLNYKGLINLEIKEYNLKRHLRLALDDFPSLHSQLLITSFIHPEIEELAVNLKYTPIQFGLLFESYPIYLENLLKQTDYNIVLCRKTFPWGFQKKLEKIKNYAKRIFVYTVNSSNQKTILRDLGMAAISDNHSR